MLVMETIITDILNKTDGLSRIRKKFLIHIFVLFLSIRGRLNFMNMSRIGKYSEKSCRTHFGQPFDFFAFNSLSADECCSGCRIAVGDCSYIPKSGKLTPHPGKFWNGCASKSEKGIEISSLAVIDIERNTAMHPECLQTPAVPKAGETRMDFYLRQVTEKKDQLKKHADYIVNDGAYAKKRYADGIVNQTDPHLIPNRERMRICGIFARVRRRAERAVRKPLTGKSSLKKLPNPVLSCVMRMMKPPYIRRS